MTCKGRETDCRVACAPRNDRVWISVKDKLPENDTDVIVCSEGGYVATVRYNDGFNCTRNYTTGEISKDYEFENVEYWMPLPEPPAKPKVEWVRKEDVLRACPTIPRSEEVREAWKIPDGMALNMGDYLAGWSDGVAAYKDAVRRMAGEEIEDD